jgi:hypothetical protein
VTKDRDEARNAAQGCRVNNAEACRIGCMRGAMVASLKNQAALPLVLLRAEERKKIAGLC